MTLIYGLNLLTEKVYQFGVYWHLAEWQHSGCVCTEVLLHQVGMMLEDPAQARC